LPPLPSSKMWPYTTTTSSRTWPTPLRLGLPRVQQPANLLQQSVHLLPCINNHEINSSPSRKREITGRYWREARWSRLAAASRYTLRVSNGCLITVDHMASRSMVETRHQSRGKKVIPCAGAGRRARDRPTHRAQAVPLNPSSLDGRRSSS
jgi:hypothetical protein